MSIAICDEHRCLARTVSDLLAKRSSRSAARALAEQEIEALADLWEELRGVGWLGLHIAEEYGGSGYGLEELVVVAEEFGRALAPGPFVPSAIAGAIIANAGGAGIRERHLPGIVAGDTIGAVALRGDVTVRDGLAHGSATLLGAGLADLLVVPAGEDVVVIERSAPGVSVETPANLDPTRRAGRARLDGAPAERLPGARPVAMALVRTILAAEATGVARACTEAAAAYAKHREQFGRPIGMFQAVKHHCANMLVATEMATAATWDAARAGAAGGDQFFFAAAAAGAVAGPAADTCAQLNIQVHGGAGFTWEHHAHLYLRRATAIERLLDPQQCAVDLTDMVRAGVRRERSMDLPPEAEAIRSEARAFIAKLSGLDRAAQREELIRSGYVMPHWPKPWGREAGALEQLVLEQEFEAAAIARPRYGITGWVILTIIQHGAPDQVARWVPPALRQELTWCQLFSEPDAGSDAAGVKTRASRVAGGWLVSGQKVWTSGAQIAEKGLATVRTNPEAPKHNGITMMAIDMRAPGVEVRPLRMPTGGSEFNEVFFDDVFVADDDVVGPVDGGWTVARATLGNESVSIGGGDYGTAVPGDTLVPLLDAHPERLAGGAGRLGRYIAAQQATLALNMRCAGRAVAGAGPGPEGNVTKLVLSENLHEAAAMLAELWGEDTMFMDGPGSMAAMLVLAHRSMSIAGGTSEIKRNQIAERILGLPRDPLLG